MLGRNTSTLAEVKIYCVKSPKVSDRQHFSPFLHQLRNSPLREKTRWFFSKCERLFRFSVVNLTSGSLRLDR